jgi:hypothetical protein
MTTRTTTRGDFNSKRDILRFVRPLTTVTSRTVIVGRRRIRQVRTRWPIRVLDQRERDLLTLGRRQQRAWRPVLLTVGAGQVDTRYTGETYHDWGGPR